MILKFRTLFKTLISLSVFVITNSAWSINELELQFMSAPLLQNNQHPQLFQLDQFYAQESRPYKMIKVVETLLQKPTTFTSACNPNVRINYLSFKFEKFGFKRRTVSQRQLGPIVILPGRAEASFKYVETALDLYDLGYGPIYVIDHRGQGLSSRLRSSWVNGQEVFFPLLQSSDRVGHLDSFECLAHDFSVFMRDIVSPNHSIEKISFIAHSTGGAVLINYFDQAVKEHIANPKVDLIPRRMALVSPMLGLDNLTNASKEFLKHPANSVKSLSRIMTCKTEGGCLNVARDKTFDLSLKYNPADVSTSSPERYLFYRLMMHFWPQSIVDSITTGWVQEARNALSHINDNPQTSTDSDLVVFTAGQDRVVDNKAAEKFCRIRANNLGRCRLDESFKTSRHAMLSESDSIRDDLLSRIHDFFQERH